MISEPFRRAIDMKKLLVVCVALFAGCSPFRPNDILMSELSPDRCDAEYCNVGKKAFGPDIPVPDARVAQSAEPPPRKPKAGGSTPPAS